MGHTVRSGPSRGRAWGTLALVSLAELLAMSLWFTASALAPELQLQWGLTPGQVGWLTTSVQLGFVAGTAVAAVLNLADLVPSRLYFPATALLGSGANALLVVSPDFSLALLARFFTGFFLAGVYPPAMKMISTWFREARGVAIGTVVGALTLGKASPYLFRALPDVALESVVLGASGAGVAGAVLVFAWYREGPFPFARSPFSWNLVARVVRHRETRLAIGGYLGHMWELYAVWVLAAPFYLAHFRARGIPDAGVWSMVMGFGVIGAGAAGSVVAGFWADRWGRERVASGAMVVSAACTASLGWLLGGPGWIVVALGLVWGFSVVADSAQFSALVADVTPRDAVGTALTLQTSLGFALTGVSIQLSYWMSAAAGWGWALTLLAVGPLLGIQAMRRLRVARGEDFRSQGPRGGG